MLAADEGDAYAQFNVGIHYYNGYGVKKDLEKAFEYFHLAAQQGIDNAQFNIGSYTIMGKVSNKIMKKQPGGMKKQWHREKKMLLLNCH